MGVMYYCTTFVVCQCKDNDLADTNNNNNKKGKTNKIAVADTEENKGLPKLQVACVDKIYSYLRNRDLRTLIVVCNVFLVKKTFTIYITI